MVKAYPTSKQKEKYLYQTERSLSFDHFFALLDCLKKLNSAAGGQLDHIVVVSFENYRKEKIRLVICSNDYGGCQIVYEECKQDLPHKDLTFENDEMVSASSGPMLVTCVAENWEKQFGGFCLKRNDNLRAIIGMMETFFLSVSPAQATNTTQMKRKQPPPKKLEEDKRRKTKADAALAKFEKQICQIPHLFPPPPPAMGEDVEKEEEDEDTVSDKSKFKKNQSGT